MVRLRKLKKPATDIEDDFAGLDKYKALEFHPHCYVQQLALAEAKKFDEIYALAHAPVQGDEE